MSVWVIIPPAVTYSAILFACAKWRSIGLNGMRWFYAWVAASFIWFLIAAWMGW